MTNLKILTFSLIFQTPPFQCFVNDLKLMLPNINKEVTVAKYQ